MAKSTAVAKREDAKRPPEVIAPEEDDGAVEAPSPSADDDELAAAEADLKGEAEEAEGAEGKKGPEAGEEEGAKAPAEAEGEGKPPAGHVPQQALHAEREAHKETKAVVEEMRGQLATLTGVMQNMAKSVAVLQGATSAGQAGASQPKPSEPSTEEKIAGLQDELVKAAEAYDKDEITMAQFELKRSEINNKIFQEHLGLIVAATGDVVRSQAPKPPSGDLLFNQETEKIEKAFPIIKRLRQEEVDPLVPIAIQRLVDSGVALRENDPMSDLKVRHEVARVANHLYHYKLSDEERQQAQQQAGDGAQPAAGDKQGTQQQDKGQAGSESSAGARPLSPQAKAVKAKIEESGRQPPNISDAGDGGTEGGLDALDEASIMKMSEDDIMALPAHVRAHIEQHGV